jgi:hypothetical protein
MFRQLERRGRVLPGIALTSALASCYAGADALSPEDGHLVAAQFVEAMGRVDREYLRARACDGFSPETFGAVMADIGDVAGPGFLALSAALTPAPALSHPDRLVFEAVDGDRQVRVTVFSGDRQCVLVEVLS